MNIFSWVIAYFSIIVLTTIIVFSITILFRERRSPQSIIAWLFFLALFPYFAFFFLLIFGIRKKSKREFSKLNLAETSIELSQSPISQTLSRLGAGPLISGNTFEIYSDPNETFQMLLEHIDAAKTSIEAEFYIVANDPVGHAFINALTKKAQSGVSVKLQIDRLGTLILPKKQLKALIAAGGEVKYFAPLLQWPPFNDFNLRNHRKIMVFDGKTAFSGGMNIGEDYMGLDANPKRFIDAGFLVTGPIVSEFAEIFRSDWGNAEDTPQIPDPTGNAALQLLPSGPDLRHDTGYNTLLNLINTAQKRIWLLSPYFVPTDELARALWIASQKGIDVRILLPRKSNHIIADAARGEYMRALAPHVTFQFFEPGMIHAKIGIIDDLGLIGSSNLDVRSLLLNFELTMLLHDPESLAQLENWYLSQEAQCTTKLHKANFIQNAFEKVFHLWSPLL